MNKRGQLTVIIIIAVVIVALGLLTYFLWPKITSLFMNEQQASRFLASQAEPLRQSVSDCVKQASLPFFEELGLNAGYYDTTGLNKVEFADQEFIVVVYKDAAKQRINKLPDLNNIENQYLAYLKDGGNDKIDSCLKNFAGFKRLMDIEVGERKITPLIHNTAVEISIDWPMKISKSTMSKKVSQNINQKSFEIFIPLGYLWQTANTIVDCEVQIDCKYEGIEWDKDTWNNPFTLQYISKEARSIDKDRIVFFLESIPYRLNEKPYKFDFAIDRS
jgi:hypothetical protein